jgi:hypothetical protein
VDVLLGNGDGTFQPFSQALTGASSSSGPCGLSISGFNGDGYPDIAVANSVINSIRILFGNGDGTFTSTTSVTVGSGPSDVAVGDFNGDGAPDLVAPLFNGSSGDSVAVLLGLTGLRTFDR